MRVKIFVDQDLFFNFSWLFAFFLFLRVRARPPDLFVQDEIEN